MSRSAIIAGSTRKLHRCAIHIFPGVVPVCADDGRGLDLDLCPIGKRSVGGNGSLTIARRQRERCSNPRVPLLSVQSDEAHTVAQTESIIRSLGRMILIATSGPYRDDVPCLPASLVPWGSSMRLIAPSHPYILHPSHLLHNSII